MKSLQETKQFAWKLAKISKHGYTDFEEQNECTNAILYLINHGIKLTSKEYFRDQDTKDFIIEPNKTHAKQIAKLVKDQFGIEPY